jgi:UDP-N-acetylglucosamine--N-acetylmuramyl-(pentapeptide) pyrophosphoryl-undecaprenol N-acetylglucosamine transferase
MSHYLIVCGGTGGHLAPGIAVAEGLLKRGHHCRLVISRKEVDSRLIGDYPHLEYLRAPGRGYGGGIFGAVASGFDLLRGMVFAWLLFKREKPDRILAFGGFLSLGMVMVARLYAIPVALHEANNRPGRVIRWVRKMADRVYMPPRVRMCGVAMERVRHYGYPVREGVRLLGQSEAREQLNIEVDRRLLVVVGGSQGAEALNIWVDTHFAALANAGVTVYCVTGASKQREAVRRAQSREGHEVYCYSVGFTGEMGTLLSAADLVISRAGAGAIAELIRCCVPSILVPYPYASDNHQLANAREHERLGAAVVVEQKRSHELLAEVEELIFNDWLLNRFKDNLRAMDECDATGAIVKDLEAITVSPDTRGETMVGETLS